MEIVLRQCVCVCGGRGGFELHTIVSPIIYHFKTQI